MATPTAEEGTIPYTAPHVPKPCATYYRAYGPLNDPSTPTPLVVLHGGPGAGHANLLPLLDLHTQHGIPMLFYDQTGCGRSTHLREHDGDAAVWTEELYLAEVRTVLAHFGLPQRGYDLLGHSWGGMLAARWASGRPEGLRRLVLANSGMDMALVERGRRRLIWGLPAAERAAIESAVESGVFEGEAYGEAQMEYRRRHMCRALPWGEEMMSAVRNLSEDKTSSANMHSKSGLWPTGALKGWTMIGSLKNIQASTLLYNGEHDAVQDVAVAPAYIEIPKVQWVTIEGTSHFCHVEKREETIELIAGFLTAP